MRYHKILFSSLCEKAIYFCWIYYPNIHALVVINIYKFILSFRSSSITEEFVKLYYSENTKIKPFLLISIHPRNIAHLRTHMHFSLRNFRKYHVVFQILTKKHHVYFLLKTTVYKYLVIKHDKILQLNLISKPIYSYRLILWVS